MSTEGVSSSLNRVMQKARGLFSRDIPAFVILLESDAERCSHVKVHVLPKLPICRVVTATNAVKAEVDEFLQTEKISTDSYRANVNFKKITGAVPDAMYAKFACTISHFRVWKTIVAEGLDHAIVLEDDVAILPGFASFVRKLRAQLPGDFDLVHLYVHHNRGEWARHASTARKLYVDYIPEWGRSAYLLSSRGAKKLLSGFREVTKSGDLQLSEMAKAGRLSVFCARDMYVDNLGQTTATYNGERFRSNIWPWRVDKPVS